MKYIHRRLYSNFRFHNNWNYPNSRYVFHLYKKNV